MKVFAIDLSMTSTGICYGDPALFLQGIGEAKLWTLTEDKKAPYDQRMSQMVCRIADLYGQEAKDSAPFIVCEDLNSMRNAKVLKALAGIRGALIFYFALQGYGTIHFASQRHARKSIGIKGDSEKEDARQYLKSEYGLDTTGPDEADAAIIWLAQAPTPQDEDQNLSL